MSNDNYRWYLEVSLRELHDLLPAQRAQLSYEFTLDATHPAHRLNCLVGNVEAVAASLSAWRNRVIDHGTTEALTKRRCDHLIVRLLAEDGTEPASIFGIDVWEKFLYAVEYSAVIRHECVPLQSNYCLGLITACVNILESLINHYGIPHHQSATQTVENLSPDTHAGNPSSSATDSTDAFRMLSEMFGWTERMTTLLISAGYVGFLAAWAYMNDKMEDWTRFSVAILFVVSLGCFSFWHAYNILRFNRASFVFSKESKIPGKFAEAQKNFFAQVGNPHRPFERFWTTRLLPFTVTTALLGALLMAAAFVHGLLVILGCEMPACKPT